MEKQSRHLDQGAYEREEAGASDAARSASLFDLIQLECLSGAREAVRVTSNGRQGHLFFEGGAMIHARSEDLIGDAAAFEILSWKTGALSASDLPWPAHHSITIAWQRLLLLAKERLDEHERPRSERSVARNVTLRSSVPLLDPVPATSTSEPASGRRSSPPGRARQPLGSAPVVRRSLPPPPPIARVRAVTPATGALGCAARFDQQDSVVAVRGDGEHLAELGPQLMRAAVALGEVLGLQGLRSIECTCAARQLLLYHDTKHSYVAVEAAPGASVGAVRSNAHSERFR